MACHRVGPQRFPDRQTTVDVAPIVRCRVRRIDAQRLDDIDHLQHMLDLRPAGSAQQDVSTWPHVGDGGAGFARAHGTQDVDAGGDRSVVVGSPTDKAEDAAGPEREDPPSSIVDLFVCRPAEAYPSLDMLLEPQQFDMREICLLYTSPSPRD